MFLPACLRLPAASSFLPSALRSSSPVARPATCLALPATSWTLSPALSMASFAELIVRPPLVRGAYPMPPSGPKHASASIPSPVPVRRGGRGHGLTPFRRLRAPGSSPGRGEAAEPAESLPPPRPYLGLGDDHPPEDAARRRGNCPGGSGMRQLQQDVHPPGRLRHQR